MPRECTDGEWPCELSTHLAWLEAENARLEARNAELEKSLVLIGERAVVDWDDTVVGEVDKLVPDGGKYKDWLKVVITSAARHERLREAAEWYLECRNTHYVDPPWPLGWYQFECMAQRAKRKSEFFETVAKSERDLRAELGEGP